MVIILRPNEHSPHLSSRDGETAINSHYLSVGFSVGATFLCYFSVVGKHIYQIERERVTYTSKTGFYWLTSAHYGVIVDNDDYYVQPGVLSIEFIV